MNVEKTILELQLKSVTVGKWTGFENQLCQAFVAELRKDKNTANINWLEKQISEYRKKDPFLFNVLRESIGYALETLTKPGSFFT